MSTINLSIPQLFEAAFGYKSSAFEPKFATLPQGKMYGKQGSLYISTDNRGVEYYLPCELNYYNGSQREDIMLPHPVVSISQGKNIVKTPLTEVNGTVKEMISLKDVDITIRGLLISADRDAPEADMYLLQEIYKSSKETLLRNVLTDIALVDYGYRVVIEDLSFPEVKGVKNVRPYEMKLVSDSIFNLIEI
jgi:hypothetical protein